MLQRRKEGRNYLSLPSFVSPSSPSEFCAACWAVVTFLTDVLDAAGKFPDQSPRSSESKTCTNPKATLLILPPDWVSPVPFLLRPCTVECHLSCSQHLSSAVLDASCRLCGFWYSTGWSALYLFYNPVARYTFVSIWSLLRCWYQLPCTWNLVHSCTSFWGFNFQSRKATLREERPV